MISDILQKIIEVNKKDPRKNMTVSDKMVKLQEEVGEIATAHLKELNLKPRAEGASTFSVRENKKEEYADALIVILDLILADGFSFEEIEEEMQKGIKKWYKKIINL